MPVRDHRRQVMELVWRSPEGTSRAQVARQLSLSRAAISQNADDLIEGGLIRDRDNRRSHSGRRPVCLVTNPRAATVLGIEIRATRLLVVVADACSRILAETSQAFDIVDGPRLTLDQVRRMVDSLLLEAGIGSAQVDAACVGVAGPVDVEAGTMVAPPIMPGWDQYPIRSALSELLRVPVIVENDANLHAVGEVTYGASRGQSNLLFVMVDTGVGLGMILNGELYRGEHGGAGEIGHLVMVDDGPLCACGNRGCLEALAGDGAIARQAREIAKNDPDTLLARMCPIEMLTAREVEEAAAQGDHAAQQLLQRAGEYLGVAIVDIVNLLNPGLVVVGGGVAGAGDLLIEPIRKAVRLRALRLGAAVEVTSASLRSRSGVMGAVAVALSTHFDTLLGPIRPPHLVGSMNGAG